MPTAPGRNTRIPRIEPRRHIVALLCDAELTYRPDTNTFSHRDGRPFTQEEQDAVEGATPDECAEAAGQLSRYLDYRNAQTEAKEALHSFLAPFITQFVQEHLPDLIEDMPEDERAKIEDLLAAVDDPVTPFVPYTF